MLHHFLFVERLAKELSVILTGAEVLECFSQQKDELVLSFHLKTRKDFHVKASLAPPDNTLSFPDKFQRKRVNSVDIFRELHGQKVRNIDPFPFERSFIMRCENDEILFKMHGNRSNIIHLRNHKAVDIFKSSLQGDHDIRTKELSKHFDLAKLTEDQLSVLEKVLGQDILTYMDEIHGYNRLALPEKGRVIEEALTTLRHAPILITGGSKPTISLTPKDNVAFSSSSPVEICNRYYHDYINTYQLGRTKEKILKDVEKRLRKAKDYIDKATSNLDRLEQRRSYEEIGHIIMANLHHLGGGSKEVELDDLYSGDKIKVRLKPELSPQKNAEIYYRKGKNEQKEIANIRQNIQHKEAEIVDLKGRKQEIEAITDFKTLNRLTGTSPKQEKSVSLPFRSFSFWDYQILVGKGARQNDQLTLKFARKNDIWLHARDVSGSHVVIKERGSGNIPKPVLEYAAGLAAYFSKRKTDTFCPVIYTEKKYVRKPKGFPPGKVVVDKESVLMVAPGAPLTQPD